jgi:hypothetical protein
MAVCFSYTTVLVGGLCQVGGYWWGNGLEQSLHQEICKGLTPGG